MQYPAALLTAIFGPVTNGVINTAATSALLGAIGANTRYRVWAWTLGLRQNTTGNLYGELTSGATFLDFMTLPTNQSDFHSIPGGRRTPNNTAITLTHTSNVAVQQLTVLLFYTIETTA